jgi:hypothetical protein
VFSAASRAVSAAVCSDTSRFFGLIKPACVIESRLQHGTHAIKVLLQDWIKAVVRALGAAHRHASSELKTIFTVAAITAFFLGDEAPLVPLRFWTQCFGFVSDPMLDLRHFLGLPFLVTFRHLAVFNLLQQQALMRLARHDGRAGFTALVDETFQPHIEIAIPRRGNESRVLSKWATHST